MPERYSTQHEALSVLSNSVSDPDSFFPDPDPGFFLNPDLDSVPDPGKEKTFLCQVLPVPTSLYLR